MKPPYELNTKILKYIALISEKIGEVNANFLNRPSPTLRKKNKIKTIQSSLRIEGNTLSESQITDIIENKRVIGTQKEILEVKNALSVYDQLNQFKSTSVKSFLKAHGLLMENLVEKPGKLRNQNVGAFKGTEVTHMAPTANRVPELIDNIFNYLKESDEPELIKSCVFHYEVEFIHPFFDGNGRMGRLWQTIILIEKYPVFEFIPFETLISETQEEYDNALEVSDKAGNSTFFIEYMLNVIEKSLDELLQFNNRIVTDIYRLEYFTSLGKIDFTRKDYMDIFKNISTSTASRDLQKGVENGMFIKVGEKNKTLFKITK